MKLLIFSKNRPMQLHACLASLAATCQDLGPGMVQVLYLATDADMAKRYETLKGEFRGVEFVPESPFGFRGGFLDLCSGTEYICFVVDDTLFVRSWWASEAIGALNLMPAAIGISLRLGKNCTHSYVKGDIPQKVPAMASVSPGWNTYHWPTAELDFDYPLEVSSSIYRATDVYPLLASGQYRNPNELEMMLASHRQHFVGVKPLLVCPEKSIAFSNPLNVVQTVCPARAQGAPGYAVDVLGRLFDAGFRIDLKNVLGYTPRAVHEEFPFNMK